MSKRYWMCIIGIASYEELPDGADQPLRRAVIGAYNKMLKRDHNDCWSGWGLTPQQKALIDNVWNGTGISIRAKIDDKWQAVDISDARLSNEDLVKWLRSRGGHNPLAENVVGILLGRGEGLAHTIIRPGR